MKIKLTSIMLLSLTIFLSSCEQREDSPETTKPWVPVETPNSFLQFINTQASLGPGEYEIIVATESAGESGNYALSVNINGESTVFTGNWVSSGGQDPSSAGNPSHKINLAAAGGITTATSASADSYLYLLKNGNLISEGNELNLPVSRIDAQTYTDAYYRAVDPNNERTTLRAWQVKNGFDQGEDAHIVFRDTKDLGYGRNMHARRDENGRISFFVKNFAANLGGDEGQYGPANLVAGIEEISQYHIGTNAIEFSPIDEDTTGDMDSDKILKFFTFKRESEIPGATEFRADTANLDGRGDIQAPFMCLVCHGARMFPLDENGEFQLLSLKSAKLNQLEVNTFEFAETGEFSKTNSQVELKLINQYVNEVYEVIGNRDETEFNRWDSSFALELSQGRYGGEGFPSDTFIEDFVPEGWRQTADRPEGVERLFTEVLEPHCISCHSIRGKTAAERRNANDINFSTYEKFISYNDKLIDYVFKRGIMPLSLLTYNRFWDHPEGAPTLLASFLYGFDVYDENNLVVEPGRAFALPGENRVAESPVQLNGSASLFARAYEWEIVSAPEGAIASLDATDIPNPLLTVDMDGPYEIGLTVTNNLGSSPQEIIVITIDSSNFFLDKNQKELTFADDIRPILGSADETSCTSCHSEDSSEPGIPVFYSDTNENLYEHVKARINLADPENSLLLRKPTNNHHGGGLRIDRDTYQGEKEYQTILNWIREGAVCGDMAGICD